MIIRVELGKWHQGEGPLSERLNLEPGPFFMEVTNARQIIEQLRTMSPKAPEAFEIWFNRSGFLRGTWAIIVNRDSRNRRAIKSEAEMDQPLTEGDCIYITSCG